MDFTLCDYAEGFKRHKALHPNQQYPQGQPGLYVGLNPMPDAIETYHWMAEQPEFDVYILTAPSIKNPHSYSEKRIWVEKYLGIKVVNKLIISPNKGLNKGDYLIDDNLSGKGQEHFAGEIIQFGSLEYPSWMSVKSYLESELIKHRSLASS